MPLLGQASGGFTESSSALRILNVGIRNTVGVLTSDSFTQTNPPAVTGAATITTQVDTTKRGVLSGSVAFARPDAAGGSNYVGGPGITASAAAGSTPPTKASPASVVLGVFINSANGNPYENTPGPASGKGPYVSAMGTYGNALFETQNVDTGVAIVYVTGNSLVASWNGYLTQSGLANNTYEASPTVIGILKMPADAVQNELVYDQRI